MTVPSDQTASSWPHGSLSKAEVNWLIDEIERLAKDGSRIAVESLRGMPAERRMQIVGLTAAEILDVIERADV